MHSTEHDRPPLHFLSALPCFSVPAPSLGGSSKIRARTWPRLRTNTFCTHTLRFFMSSLILLSSPQPFTLMLFMLTLLAAPRPFDPCVLSRLFFWLPPALIARNLAAACSAPLCKKADPLLGEHQLQLMVAAQPASISASPPACCCSSASSCCCCCSASRCCGGCCPSVAPSAAGCAACCAAASCPWAGAGRGPASWHTGRGAGQPSTAGGGKAKPCSPRLTVACTASRCSRWLLYREMAG